MRFNVISLFPEMVKETLKFGVVGTAVQRGLIELNLVNPRQFTTDIHHTVDDRPYGGGDGMIMQFEPLKKSVESIGSETRGHVVYLSAQGRCWDNEQAKEWAQNKKNITLICGRYGGIDQRFINEYVDQEISIGDYILSGGEIAAMTLIDSMSRFLPGVLGNSESSENETFANDGLLEGPQFTRPREIVGCNLSVPDFLLSGDHQKIKMARQMLSLLTTALRRPDLLTDLHKKNIKPALLWALELSNQDLIACGLMREELLELYAKY